MKVQGTSAKCNRWFFKFNGNECSGPMTIEAVVYNYWPSGNPNLLHHRSFEGYCENIPQGRVIVELWVGKCLSGQTLGNAHTGWQSVSRIMIEEVSRAQSWLLLSFLYKEWWTILNFSIILAFKISPTIDILKYVMFYFLSQTYFSSLNISPTFCAIVIQDN